VNVLVLTGAGISRESGLPIFRGAEGLWREFRAEDLATPEAFARRPALVHEFYNERRRKLRDPTVQPNAAHLALAELDRDWAHAFLLVTQNVDDLHDRAGSKRLLHMHGELAKIRCLHCGAVRARDGDISSATPCPACGREGGLRPDVVWFGEMPMYLDEIYAALERAELFVSIGTSGAVYPAAGFVSAVRGRAHTVELNLEPSDGSHLFDEVHHGPATTVVPEFVRGLLRA
jgi:NAD-dependent deacetylase